jgi:HK97 gp10 family phage protein
MKVTVKLSGFKEIEVALDRLEKQATKKTVARNALKKAGEPVAEAMRAKATRVTGQLADNIAVSTRIKGEAGKAAYADTMRKTSGNKALAVKAMRDARRAAKSAQPPVMMFVGPTVKAPHAHLVEFGTAPHTNGGTFAGSRHPGTSPRPFVRPAWDAEQEATLQRIADEMRVQIAKAITRQARRKAKG